jgi:competence ComEA-like helix-hairpin-helix protein
MKVTVSQRRVLFVILAMALIVALLVAIMQSAEVEKTIAKTPPMVIKHQKNIKTNLEHSGLDKPVKINSATAAEIANSLEGIGEAIAQRIVNKRQKQGPFQNFEQLKTVSGVGAAKIEANKQRISFD